MDIPEIRSLIAEHMELDTLCSAALVCRTWHDTCMPLIWNNISWTSQVHERPTPEALLANAHLVRTVTIFTMKLDASNSNSRDGGGDGRDGAGEVGAGTRAGAGSGTETAAVAEEKATNTGTRKTENKATMKAERGFPFAPCKRIEELNLQLNIRQALLWDNLTDLVRHNPGLKTLSVFLSGVPPTLDFMQALARTDTPSTPSSPSTTYTSPSSPHGSGTGSGDGLKTFMTMFLDLNKETTEALLDLATRLESLQLNGATTVDPESLDRWPIFPNLVTLKLGLSSGITPHHQLQIIQRCPQLRSLAWDLEESAATGPLTYDGPQNPTPDTTAYYNYQFPTTAVCQLFEPEFCPLLEKLSITYPALSDRELARVVEACPRLTLFEVFETGFGARAFQAMTRHFAHLTRLDIRRCSGVTSPMAQQILTSCRRLVFFCGDALHARDIVGLQPQQQLQGTSADGTVQSSEEQHLQPQDWVCTDLTWLTLYICGLENAPPTWLPIVLTQLARLTSLDFLTISPTGPEFDGTNDGLPLSLSSGLATLSTLTNLERFCFHGLAQEMQEADVQWMVDSWPRLVRVEGVVHPERERRMAIEPILRREGIEVCGYFGDDDEDVLGLHVIASEDEDGEEIDFGGQEEDMLVEEDEEAVMGGLVDAPDQPVEGHPMEGTPPPPPPGPQDDQDQA
ncbi:hypothetical protein K457DRAFT_141710 [Linnemannia elongata AG-77]|uniref:F-box domain-containing protein n=1 Tax=Linnemannia elongata AG-77 TaxID=1314771 RepID=A0A197JHM3_9FUNG|nr:hypothetical protein K457DRAFT_141710 [Linnemannia elongata AG-77]